MGFSHPLAFPTLLDDSFVLQLVQALGRGAHTAKGS